VKTFFVQHDSSADETNCLKVSREWHRAYAKQHAMEYIEDYEKIDAAPFSKNSEGQVWFFKKLKSLPLNSIVMDMDGDVLIVKPEVNIPARLAAAGIEFQVLGGQHIVGINGGVMMCRNTAALQDWLESLIASGPELERRYGLSGNRIMDHKILIALQDKCPIKFGFFDDRFNWFAEYKGGKRTVLWEEKDAIVKAWHGVEPKKRVNLLREELHRLSEIAA
jgi:hypothetical protein